MDEVRSKKVTVELSEREMHIFRAMRSAYRLQIKGAAQDSVTEAALATANEVYWKIQGKWRNAEWVRSQR